MNNISVDTSGDEEEEWRPVVGYEGYYEVSNMGRVRSLDRIILRSGYGNFMKSGCILTLDISNRGYVNVKLHLNGNRKGKLVHRLVAEAFIEKVEGKTEVNHKYGNKLDNSVENLEWNTSSENNLHAYRTGLNTPKRGQDSGKNLLLDYQILEICKLLDSGATHSEIAVIYKVNVKYISTVHTGQSWNHLTNRRGNVKLNITNRGSTHGRASKVRNCRGEIFGSIIQAAITYNISNSSLITRVCRGLRKSTGLYPDTNEKIRWEYVN